MAARTEPQIPVLVVGAGPVGLTMALALSSYGVPCTLLDKEPRHVCDGSRSICVQKHTLELAELIGAGRALAEEGVTWSVARTYFRNTELFSVRLGAAGPGSAAFRYPPFVNIPQRRVEEILLSRVEARASITVLWSHAVTGLRQDGDDVTVEVATPDGPAELRAAYVVGCDGGHSTVRERLGVGFPGYTHGDRFLIADIRADLPFPDERRFFFDPPWNPGRQVLVHPQPDKVWRIDWQVPAPVDVEEERRTGRLDERIRRVLGGDVDYEIVWLSQYTFAQRLAERFRVRRVFLAGDAAHLMSVFGARGMNSGMQDAVNLAWKLALVRAGHAPDALLDSYEAERRPAAEENLRVTEATMRFMVPPTRAGWLLRNTILRLSLPVPWLRRYVNSGKLSQPYVYADSPIVARSDGAAEEAAGAARVGAVTPDASARGPDGSWVRVLDLVGGNFTALYLAPDAAIADRFAREAAALRLEVSTRVVTVVPSGTPARDRLVDDQGEFAAAFGAAPGPSGGPAGSTAGGRLYVIRPDTHVAVRLDGATAADLRDLLERATGRAVSASGSAPGPASPTRPG